MQIKYKHLMWSIIAIFMIIFVIDRFTFNVWPLYFTHDNPIADVPSATIFFIVGWIAGRELIVASAFIWLLQCRCLWNWVFENKPKWLLVDDIMIENNHMHYTLGWAAIAIPMVVHTWLVFLPLVEGVPLKFYSTWYRPIDHALDPDFFVETYHHHTVNVSINDLVALIILTVTFLALFPLSMNAKFRARHWGIAQYVHQIAALSYGIELLRTPLTAHCWFLCTPFIILFIVDRILATFYYRFTDKARVVCQYNFDDKYFLLCLRIPDIYYHIDDNPEGCPREIGDVFWLNSKGFAYRKIPQAAHPFTSFYNHNNAIPNITEFLQSQEVRNDLAHPSHKFPITKRRAQDEAVKHTDIATDPAVAYQLGRTPTVDPAKMSQHKSLSEQDGNLPKNGGVILGQTSVTLIREEEEEDQFAERQALKQSVQDDKVSKVPDVRALKNTNSVFINKQVELSRLKEQKTVDRLQAIKAWEWNVGFIIRVHERNDKYGFTQRIAARKAIKDEDSENFMMTYGPYRSSFANIIPFLNGPVEHDQFEGAVILIATGAGAAYMIDTMLYLRGKFKADPEFALATALRIHFSCRSVRLFQWVTNFLCAEKLPNVAIFANLTSHKNIHNYDEDENVELVQDDDGITEKSRKASSAKIGRASFKDVLRQSPHKSRVFFCGHPRIQANIKLICKDLHFTFYEGHSFG